MPTAATEPAIAATQPAAPAHAPSERPIDAERAIDVRAERADGAPVRARGTASDRADLTPSAPAPDVVAGSAPVEAAAVVDRRDDAVLTDRPVPAPVHDEGAARDRLLATYAAGASALREAVRGLSAEELRAARLHDGTSIARVLVHLADTELHGIVRMRRILAEPGSVLQPYDHERWLAALGDLTTPGAALELFAALRRVGEEMMRAATPEQRAQRCMHPEHGEVTLDLVLERHAEYGEAVIARIRGRSAELREWEIGNGE